MELVLGEVQSNAKGGKYLPIKGKDGCNMFHSTQWAAVVWEPSAYAAEGDSRVNVSTEELAEAVSRWETAAAGLAIKHAASMFGKPLSQAQMQERLQSCLKTSAQGLGYYAQRALLGLGGKAGRGAHQPARPQGPGGDAAAAALGDEAAVRAGSGASGRQAGRAGRRGLPPIRVAEAPRGPASPKPAERPQTALSEALSKKHSRAALTA